MREGDTAIVHWFRIRTAGKFFCREKVKVRGRGKGYVLLILVVGKGDTIF